MKSTEKSTGQGTNVTRFRGRLTPAQAQVLSKLLENSIGPGTNVTRLRADPSTGPGTNVTWFRGRLTQAGAGGRRKEEGKGGV